jgi:predicted dehydrogenase
VSGGAVRLGVIGTGWIGGMRARTAAASARVAELHLAEIDPRTAAAVATETDARSWSADYHEILDRVDAVVVSSTPETTHFPIARDCLRAGKHVLLEKPMGLTLGEADELLALARAGNLLFTVGYTQRFNPKFAFVKQSCVEGRLGRAVTILVSRHLTRALGSKISGRGELGPAQMEATHDIDLALWWLEGVAPVRVYAQSAHGVMREAYGLPDCTWIMIGMEDGAVLTVGAGWALPPEAPGFCSATFEVVGTKGALFVDDSHRDLLLSTTEGGLTRPLSSMPGEAVGAVFRGPLEAETRHFIDCVALGRPPLVTPEQARLVMEVTLAADLSAQRGLPVSLPLRGD